MLIQEWTAEGKRQLGAVIRSTEYRDEYVRDLVKDWNNQLTVLSTIAETQPQAAYLAFASGFKSKINYFLRTTPNICHLLLLLERTIWNRFIPAVAGCYKCSDTERVLISLPTRYGGFPFQYFLKQRKLNLWTPAKSHQNLQY